MSPHAFRLTPTPSEQSHRDEVYARILQFTAEGRTIKLPPFQPGASAGNADYALLAIEDNEFSGTVGEFRYQFEGEDDLLHVAVMRRDGKPLSVEDSQQVVAFLLPKVSPALIWLRPGTYSQHFYVGHDELSL